MAVVYLEPGDLSTAQQTRVLEFLNQATSAAQLAERIEFPDELDIGIRLAQRLLDARATAGGAFSSLAQVDAVPLIGPERFTEICAAALGMDPRNLGAGLDRLADRQNDYLRDYARLQSQLGALLGLSEQVILDVRCTPQPAWLGQRLDVRLDARDANGRPLANRRITVEASAGRLEVAYGLAIQSGPVVEVRTGADGSVRLSLFHTPREPLTTDQQAALEEVLALLEPTADSPHALKDDFLQIAAAYQEERSSSLREALDIYASEGKAQFFDQLNASNLGFYWPMTISVLRAHYHPDEVGTNCTAQAVCTARWKNWVGAWFEYLGDYLSGTAGLQQAFAAAKQRGVEGFRLVDDIIGSAHCFVADQKGLAAQWLSQRVVKYAMHDFLALETAEMDDATQRELFSHLEIASEQLTPTNRGTLSAVNQARVELDTRIDQVSGFNTDLLAEMRGVHEDVIAEAARVKDAERSVLEAKTAVDAQKAAVDAQKAAVDAQKADFDAKYALISDDISVARSELTEFRTERADITREISTLKDDMATVKVDLVNIGRTSGGG